MSNRGELERREMRRDWPAEAVCLQASRSGWQRAATICSLRHQFFAVAKAKLTYRPENLAAMVCEQLQRHLSPPKQSLRVHFDRAHREVRTRLAEYDDEPDVGGGVELTVARIDLERQYVHIGWSGKQPLYGVTPDELVELTEAHTLWQDRPNLHEDLKNSGYRDILTRSLGHDPDDLEPFEFDSYPLDEIDWLLSGTQFLRHLDSQTISSCVAERSAGEAALHLSHRGWQTTEASGTAALATVAVDINQLLKQWTPR